MDFISFYVGRSVSLSNMKDFFFVQYTILYWQVFFFPFSTLHIWCHFRFTFSLASLFCFSLFICLFYKGFIYVKNHFFCFQNDSFVFTFWQYDYNVFCCETLLIYPILRLLGFLDHMFVPQIWKIFACYIFLYLKKYFSRFAEVYLTSKSYIFKGYNMMFS